MVCKMCTPIRKTSAIATQLQPRTVIGRSGGIQPEVKNMDLIFRKNIYLLMFLNGENLDDGSQPVVTQQQKGRKSQKIKQAATGGEWEAQKHWGSDLQIGGLAT